MSLAGLAITGQCRGEQAASAALLHHADYSSQTDSHLYHSALGQRSGRTITLRFTGGYCRRPPPPLLPVDLYYYYYILHPCCSSPRTMCAHLPAL